MNNNKIKIFLVDDDVLFLKLLEIECLKHPDFIVETYPTGELCLAHLSNSPDVIVLDYHLNGIDKQAMNGIETLNHIKIFKSDIPVIMLSAQEDMDVALDCMQNNAFDYVTKNKSIYLRLPQMIATIFSCYSSSLNGATNNE